MIPVTDPIIPTETPTMIISPVFTTGVNITSISLDTRRLSVTGLSTPSVTVVGARDSIFNVQSFDIALLNLEHAIRQQVGSADKNELRAAIYTGLMAIARTAQRTPEEQAVMNWPRARCG